MFTPFYKAFGAVLDVIYNLVNNYGIALILFTFVIKLLLFPLGIKQQKSTIKQIKIRPKEELIRKKYAYDKNLQNQKVMELYQKEGFNPMGGCLPLLIQLPIIMILWQVIQHPAEYVGGITNFPFLGLDMTVRPTFGVNPYILFPIISAISAYVQGVISQSAMKYTATGQQQQGTNKVMMLIAPVMSLWIGFTLPTGVAVYWIASNIFGIIQTIILNKMYSPADAYHDAMQDLRDQVARRRVRKEAAAQEKTRAIEQAKLDKKNAARKAAGLKPLKNLEGAVDTSENDESVEEKQDD